jgi:hypothetical protein
VPEILKLREALGEVFGLNMAGSVGLTETEGLQAMNNDAVVARKI